MKIDSVFFLYFSMILYFCNTVFLSIMFVFFKKTAPVKQKSFFTTATVLHVFAFLCSFCAVVFRWIESGHIPLANTYETMLVFIAVLNCLYFFWQKKDTNRYILSVLCAVSLVAAGAGTLIKSAPQELPAALQNSWLGFHVLTCIFAYAAFTLAFATSCFALFAKTAEKSSGIVYRAILSGVFFLTLGIISGAIWADHAWGRYWSWDPKETWALICWLYYVLFLHLKSRRLLSEKRLLIFAAFGFAVVIFTFFGVNYILGGLHSYV